MSPLELRRRLRALQAGGSSSQKPTAREREFEALSHELEVHQIELEIQNRELMESRRELEISHDRYVSLYDLAPISYITLDRQGVIKEINLTAASLLGTERSRLLNRTLLGWIEKLDRPKFRAHIAGPTSEGETATTQLGLVGRDKQVTPVQMQSTYMVDIETGEHWLRTAIMDLTEQHMLVERLENERILREKFVSGLTHDLRTPLAAARLSAQLIIREAARETALFKRASRVVENLSRTEHMILDLLDANRIQAGEGISLKVEYCDLQSMLKAAVNELAAMYGERLQFSCNQVITGYWDCKGLRRCVENLVSNAVKYGCPESPITISLKEKHNWVELSVHNMGNPIPPEDQATLFRQFRRTKAALQSGQKGWGIGLTLVRGVAESHGGKAKVESSREKGTTFYVLVPKDARPRLEPEQA